MLELVNSLLGRDIISHLKGIVLNEDATFGELLFLTFSLAVFWFVFFQVFCRIVSFLIKGKEWVRVAAIKEYHRYCKEEMEEFGVKMSEEEFIEKSTSEWPYGVSVNIQHVAGALLAVPSCFGLFSLDSKVASSLACLGILSEAGWEIQDMTVMIYTRLFTVDGKKKFPNAAIAFGILHHSLATLLGIPTIMSYRYNKLLHWTCFDLQGAGALGFVFEYTRHLDVTKKSDMLQFLGCNFFAFLVLLWTRTFHWLYISSMFIYTWYQDEAWVFLVLGSIVLFFFSFMNIFLITLTIFKRFMKFWKQYKEHNALPVDASPEEKRSSAIQLNIVASQVLSHHHLFYVPTYSEGKPTLTQSMPPLYSSFMGRTSMFVDLDKRMTYTFGDSSEQWAL